MNRQEKADFVRNFREEVQASPIMVIARFEGTSVNVINDVRRKLDDTDITFRVVKNTLAHRALEGTDYEELQDELVGMNAVVLTGEDPIAGAKILKEIGTSVGTIEARVGLFEGRLLDAAALKALADMPSKEELLAMLLRTMQEPSRRILGVLQAPARDLLYLLKNYEQKLSEAEGD